MWGMDFIGFVFLVLIVSKTARKDFGGALGEIIKAAQEEMKK